MKAYITTKDRPKGYDGRRKQTVAIYLTLDGIEQNIWDLPKKQVTPEVLTAIAKAVERGFQTALAEMSYCRFSVTAGEEER